MAAALAASSGRSRAGVAAVAAAVGAGQLSVGWCNDYLDRERDVRAGRRDKPIARGDLEPGIVRWAAGVSLAAVPLLSRLSGRKAGVAHTSAVALAWSYNLGLKA